MNIETEKRKPNMRREMRYWLNSMSWSVAATFTFADNVSERTAQKIMRDFWVRVDKRLYGNEVMRRSRRCNRVNVVEGGVNGKRIHYHSAILRPSDRFQTNNEFCHFLTEVWNERFGRHFKIQICSLYDAKGWNQYITKNVSRADCDTIDVHSSHVAAPTC